MRNLSNSCNTQFPRNLTCHPDLLNNMALHVQPHAIQDVTASRRHGRRTPVRLHDPCAPQHSAKNRKLRHPVIKTHMSARSSYMMVYSDNYESRAPGEARIKVLGVGGGGGNALQRMIASGMQVSRCNRWKMPKAV